MIASWMLYALAISVLITMAALAAERAGEARGWPIRIVWTGALVLSVAWPIAPVVARMMPTPPPPVNVLPFTIVLQAPAADAPASIDRALLVDRALMIVWAALSALLIARIAFGVRAVRRARAQWKRRSVDGMSVQISDNVGPAVVGLATMDVVLPAWILSLDAPLRAIVLRHEEEHRLARDPYLLFGAAVAVALIPWNLALWFQARRLRLAVEMDCDARVLRAHPSPERYGLLMLTIAQRRSIAPAMFAPMLSEPTTNLERRILAMRSTTKKVARVTVYGGGLVAVAVLAFASTLQSAGRSFPKPKMPVALAEAANFIAPASAPMHSDLRSDTQTVRALPAMRVRANAARGAAGVQQQGNPGPRYPDLLRAAGIEGSVVARYTSDAAGVPDSSTIEIISSTHTLFTNAVLRVLPLWHVAPNTTTETPFTFVIGGAAGMTAPVTSINGKPVNGVLIVAPRGGAPSAPRVHQTQPIVTAASDVAGQTVGAPKRVNDNDTYFEFQVEQAAMPAPGQRGPRYPDELRAAHVEGEVLVQVVVDTLGNAMMDTFKVLKSSNAVFTDAVRDALPSLRFIPAEVGHRKVRQLIQMPFQFNLSKS
jgi:TonB family protein